jgi:hypothetical protein
MTIHRSQGLTIKGGWDRSDGSVNRGSVLVYAPGADANGLHVATSRHQGDVFVFGARQDLETEQDALLEGVPSTPQEQTARMVAALAEHAEATQDNANDRPVLDDLADGETETPLSLAERVTRAARRRQRDDTLGRNPVEDQRHAPRPTGPAPRA